MVKPLVPPAVDIFGPYASTPQSVTSRPGKAGDAAGAGFSWSRDCSDDDAEDGTPITAEMQNNWKAQFLTLFQASPISIDNSDEMMARAVRSQGVNYAAVSGSVNARILTLDPAPLSWAELVGAPLRALIPSVNNGAATGAVAGLAGTKPIVRNDNGAALEGGELIGLAELIYDGTSLRLLNIPRLRTPRVTVGAGGVTVTAADEYTTYVMPLGTRQVFTLPAAATMPIGFSTLLEVTGAPSGFQTAYVNVTGGGNLFYRGGSTTSFRLIGGGEVFEFVNTGTQWLVRLVSQPNSVILYRTANGQPGTVALPTSYTDVVLDSNSGSPALFQYSNGRITLPVSGVYNVYGGVVGYNNIAAWGDIDLAVFDYTTGTLLQQAGVTIPAYNNFNVSPKVNFTAYYSAGTVLLLGARGPGGNAIIQGNASEFSVILTGR